MLRQKSLIDSANHKNRSYPMWGENRTGTCLFDSSSKNQACVDSVHHSGIFFCLVVSANQISNGGRSIWILNFVFLAFWDSQPIQVACSLPLYLLVLPHGGRLSLWHTFNGIHQFFHEKSEKTTKLVLQPRRRDITLSQMLSEYHTNCNAIRLF